jgi:hypothetical protein
MKLATLLLLAVTLIEGVYVVRPRPKIIGHPEGYICAICPRGFKNNVTWRTYARYGIYILDYLKENQMEQTEKIGTLTMGSCAVYKPTIWNRFGFGYAGVAYDDEDATWAKPGSISSDILVHLGWQDRLRVLFSGWISLATKTKTDVIVENAHMRSSVKILPPGFKPV